jgi:hypothetical protein
MSFLVHINMQALISCIFRHLKHHLGFEGLRFDYSKGYAGKFAAKYARAALGNDEGLVVGEYWVPLRYDAEGSLVYDQEHNRQEVTRWIDDTGGRCLAFDFATKGILQVCHDTATTAAYLLFFDHGCIEFC